MHRGLIIPNMKNSNATINALEQEIFVLEQDKKYFWAEYEAMKLIIEPHKEENLSSIWEYQSWFEKRWLEIIIEEM